MWFGLLILSTSVDILTLLSSLKGSQFVYSCSADPQRYNTAIQTSFPSDRLLMPGGSGLLDFFLVAFISRYRGRVHTCPRLSLMLFAPSWKPPVRIC